MSADVELWGHVELPSMLLDNEVELRAELRGFYSAEEADEFDRVVLTPPSHLVSDRHGPRPG